MTASADGATGRDRWYLESLADGPLGARRVPVHPVPFRVGRSGPLGLTLGADSVSKLHAELSLRDGVLWVRDLGSRNGTFVNGERVSESAVAAGDVLHFAGLEFHVAHERAAAEAKDPALATSTVSLDDLSLPQQFVAGARQLRALLDERRVTALFQPVVALPSGALAGVEALGRGEHPDLPEAPLELFRVAEAVGAERELSRLFRERALELAATRGRMPMLFLNVHASELGDEALAASIARARHERPELRLTVELHETALDDLDAVGRLREALGRAGVGLAYDGFGANQARLVELAEAPPHYLKFARGFVSGIDKAPQRQRIVASLLAVARDLLVHAVAQGVETPEEADVCRRLGFTHAQGFLFGRPRPIEAL